MAKTKYRKVFKPCVLCGEETADWDYVCKKCRADHALGKSYRESETERIAANELLPHKFYCTLWNDPTEDLVEGLTIHSKHQLENTIERSLSVLLGGDSPGGSSKMAEQYVHSLTEQEWRSYRYSSFQRVLSYHHITKAQAEAANTLLLSIRKLIGVWWKHGYTDGSSLLMSLANGKTNIDHFNKESEKRFT